MQVEEELARVAPEQDTLLTIGVFDGVHLGHRHLISQLVKEALLSKSSAKSLKPSVLLIKWPRSI